MLFEENRKVFSKDFRWLFLPGLFTVGSFSGTVVGENDLSEIFAQRPRLNARITELIDAATGPWGIEVSQAGAFDQARSGSMFWQFKIGAMDHQGNNIFDT